MVGSLCVLGACISKTQYSECHECYVSGANWFLLTDGEIEWKQLWTLDAFIHLHCHVFLLR